ncbi:YHS domain-containing (seleno)protein [Curvivirga aplysinae]|uniref:YHS domain-containing (seleno)protein n=1 Tax=Curvivirga aplysinae TaxID=2529852 RepID=UPI0012BCDEF7|nr:YHS domain-containing (seleno)protein [Curvivirga aplysinae]MTI09409.1 YHS domain-containing protein [Curvivirga aplysinae]
MKTPVKILLAALAFSTFMIGKAFAIEPIYTGWLSDQAVGGYDTVSYFTNGEPVKGSKDHKVTWNGATWLFSSAENKALFEADPEKYAPQYGGYCAWAVAEVNEGYEGDPKIWKIVDGKLYLNNNDSVQERWNKDIPGFIETANKNWPGLLSK